MYSLIGDRFLERFFGSRSHRHRDNPAGEAGTLRENEAEKPKESDYTKKEDSPEKEALPENTKTSEINKLSGREDGSEQQASDIKPGVSDEQKD